MFYGKILARIESALTALAANIGSFETTLKAITIRIGWLEKSAADNSAATAALCDRVHALELKGDK